LDLVGDGHYDNFNYRVRPTKKIKSSASSKNHEVQRMATVSPPIVKNPPVSRPFPLDWTAGALSYLIPGMGQVSQGRVAKGIFFLVSIYGLFFYGMYLGSWKNVYLPDTADKTNPWNLPRPLANIYNRPQFAGQFWIGVAAWPAVWQYNTYNAANAQDKLLKTIERQPSEKDLNDLERDGDKTRDLGWVLTVIAGVLNIMVMYDAVAGPAFRATQNPSKEADAHAAAAPVSAGR
jgi:hypothetical protein